MEKHSAVGASSAERWLNCPGSVELIKKAPPQKPSKYADEGTDAHELAWLCLEHDKDPASFLGQRMTKGYEVTEEMVDAVRLYIDTIESYKATGKFIMKNEVKFDIGLLHADFFGTADSVLISSDMKRLVVVDFKYGAGVPVEAENNKQGLFYLLGAVSYAFKKAWVDNPLVFGWHQTFEDVEICIVQPRCRHKEGPVRSWSVMSPLLDEFADELLTGVQATEQKDAPLESGKHCKFCPAMAICPAFGKEIDESAANSFSVIKQGQTPNLPKPTELSLDQVARIVEKSELITAWLKAVNAYAEDLAIAGEEIPGYKLVMKKGHRKWVNEDEVVDRVSMVCDTEDLYTKKLKSPNQVEGVIGKKNKGLIEDLYETPELGPTLVPEHDKREALAPGSMFNVIEDQTKPTKGD